MKLELNAVELRFMLFILGASCKQNRMCAAENQPMSLYFDFVIYAIRLCMDFEL